MKLSPEDKLVEHGRVIARGMHLEKVQQEKNMIKADRRKATMLENAAEIALSGGVQRRRSQN